MLHFFLILFAVIACFQYNNWFTFSEYEEPVTIRSCRPIHAKEITMVSTLLLYILEQCEPYILLSIKLLPLEIGYIKCFLHTIAGECF
jgi:hypothetical protein